MYDGNILGGIFFSSENVWSLELFLHALLERTDFFNLMFYILKWFGNGKNRKNQFSFSTGGPCKASFAKIQTDTSQHIISMY